MPHRPMSFTKNLGGLEHLHEAIRSAYRPNITLREFEARLPSRFAHRRLVIIQFFLATRLIGRTEYVVDDTLITSTLSEPYGPTLARLYLFTLLLNMPGQRLKRAYRSPAPAQNEFARIELHDGVGWRASGTIVNTSILPWARKNVAATGGLRKFATNLSYFFEQAQFDVNPDGRYITYANHWAPLAIRLFFDRYTVHRPFADVDELVGAARQHELHRLMGLDIGWLNSVIDGIATTYLSANRHLLSATAESASDRTNLPSTPAGRRTALTSRLIRATRNKITIQQWYDRSCQICGVQVMGASKEPSIDYAHIRPLGEPHNGPDTTENMLSLCPNHHRQLDRGGIGIEPSTLQILAPHGSAPAPFDILHRTGDHTFSRDCLEYHRHRIFNH